MPTTAEILYALLYAVVVPAVVQGWKFLADRLGQEPSRTWLQAVLLLISLAYVGLTDGFAGVISIGLPPAWGGDLVPFLDGWMGFISALVAAVYLAYRMVTGIYDGLARAVFEQVGFATRSALARRKALLAEKRSK